MNTDCIYMAHSPCFPRFSLLIPFAPLAPLVPLFPFPLSWNPPSCDRIRPPWSPIACKLNSPFPCPCSLAPHSKIPTPRGFSPLNIHSLGRYRESGSHDPAHLATSILIIYNTVGTPPSYGMFQKSIEYIRTYLSIN
jgi:hypothetical protein